MKALEFTVRVYLLPFISRTREYGGPKQLRIWLGPRAYTGRIRVLCAFSCQLQGLHEYPAARSVQFNNKGKLTEIVYSLSLKDLLLGTFGPFGDLCKGCVLRVEGCGVCPRNVSWAGENNRRMAFTKVPDIPEPRIPFLIRPYGRNPKKKPKNPQRSRVL